MATKSAKVSKTGDKRKASTGQENAPTKISAKKHESKIPKNAPAKKDGPESARKLWAKKDTSDDSSDDEGSSEEDEEAVEAAAPPAKKARHALEHTEPSKQFQKEKSESSREAHVKQKAMAKERKAARPLAEELHRAKKLWEKLRRKSHVSREERVVLVDELLEIITGRVKDFVLKHDAVRAVQTALKYAKREQRISITKELQGTYAELAESRYAKFLIGKMLVQNDPEIRDMIIPEFYGKVRRLINHPEASWILDDIYRGVATKEQKAILLREWYGPEFSLFRTADKEDTTADLSQILEKAPEKRGTIIKYLMSMIDQLVQKKMNGFTMLHDAMLQCFLNVSPGTDAHTELMEKVKDDESGDLLKNMAFTKSGSRLACLLLAHGTAKDRRQYLKLYKDTYETMCGDQYGHAIILTAYDVIDDTKKGTAKSIFPEVLGKEDDKSNIIFCANNINARITVLYLFEGTSRALFPLSHDWTLEILKEVHEIRKTTSKKDPEVRRTELIAALSPPLLEAITKSARDLVSTSFGSQFVTDVLIGAEGDKSKALKAVAETAAGDPSAVKSDELYSGEYQHPAQTNWAGWMFKTLIQGGRFDKTTKSIKLVEPPLDFANILYPIIKDHLLAWATGRSSFVVVALLESDSFTEKSKIKSLLKRHKAELEKAATEAIAIPEAEKEVEEKDAGVSKNKKKRSAFKKKPRPIGNAGAKILLGKL